ncbi:hypothetical protein JOC95_002051 [Bacillus tianshenii]|uniref:Uncharacterized protein n=1 Tax=Sutcliffiella tianshenii TaxID=1463404 RepID=A0ABS2P0D2_9BACI|nr:hypothetical protein [Bacillus tianshenii]
MTYNEATLNQCLSLFYVLNFRTNELKAMKSGVVHEGDL